MTKAQAREYVESHVLREEISRRGGGIEIDLSPLLETEGYRMTAYQNYLGGGLLGAIANSYNFNRPTLSVAQTAKLDKVVDALNRYFHSLTNAEAGEYDEWNRASYDAVQARPESAY